MRALSLSLVVFAISCGGSNSTQTTGTPKAVSEAKQVHTCGSSDKTHAYDLRHSLGTLAHLETGGDLKSTMSLLGVSAPTALRYAKGALDPRLQAAVGILDGILGRKPDRVAAEVAGYPDPDGS